MKMLVWKAPAILTPLLRLLFGGQKTNSKKQFEGFG
jgi:hypothetical protein